MEKMTRPERTTDTLDRMTSGPVLTISNLAKHFTRSNGSSVPAIDGVSLDVYPGEFLVLLGPSGCGKSTLLRTVAGLERPDSGKIALREQVQYSSEANIFLPPERRKGMSMVFQSYALWPHMTAEQNIAYPLLSVPRRARESREAIADRVANALQMVGLPDLGQQHPSQLSGGQQQRVALARALAADSELILFDEPLSNVDAKVREQLRLELLSLQAKIGFAALFVTHDQTEAMALGNRIVVLQEGRVAQVGSPEEIYNRPASRYVADFIGSLNQLNGSVQSVEPDRIVLDTELGLVSGVPSVDVPSVGDRAVAVWRPESCKFSVSARQTPYNSWRGSVFSSHFLGAVTEYLVDVQGVSMRVAGPSGIAATGDDGDVFVAATDVRILPY